MASKSNAQYFTSEWNKAIAHAQAQGIPASDYAPVYALDLQRLQQGQYPMSPAERNRAIITAATPNQVTPTPADHPSPWSLWGNIWRNVGQIAVGLIKAPEELWNMGATTIDAIEGKKHLTAGQWMDSTLLSLIPGFADVGEILQAGSLGKGLELLAENPITSLLDVLPDTAIATKLLAHTEVGAALAARLGVTPEELARMSPAKATVKALGKVPAPRAIGGGAGVAARAGALTDRLTVSDALNNLLVNMKWRSAGPVAADVAEAVNTLGQTTANLANYAFQPLARATNSLSPTDFAQFSTILDTYKTRGGDVFAEAMANPAVSVGVKKALEAFERVDRFSRGEQLAAADLAAIRSPLDGQTRLYATKSAPPVVAARDAVTEARRAALDQLGATHRLVGEVTRLDTYRDRLVTQLQATLGPARQELPNVEGTIRGEVTSKTRTPSIGKRAQATAVFGPGGLVDDLTAVLAKGDESLDQLEALLPVVSDRLRAWGPRSVAAGENPAFAAVARQVEGLKRYVDVRRRLTDEIDHRLTGLHEGHKAETRFAADLRRRQLDDLTGEHAEAERQLRLGHTLGVNRARGEMVVEQDRLDQGLVQLDQLSDEKLLGEAYQRLSPKARRSLDAAVKSEKATTRRAYVEGMKEAETKYAQVKRTLDQRYTIDRLKGEKKLAADKAALEKAHRERPVPAGELVQALGSFYDAQRRFQQAVWDTPTDAYRDAYLALYAEKLHQIEQTHAAFAATASHYEERSGITAERWDAIHENPRVWAELVDLSFNDVYGGPDVDPEAAKFATEARDFARESAKDELQKLIAQGFKVPWQHSVSSFAERAEVGVRASLNPVIGHGIPRPDAASAKVWDWTAKRHDVLLAAEHNLAQTLRRDATVELHEHYLAPHAVTASQLRDMVVKHASELTGVNVEDLVAGPGGQTATDVIQQAATKWGLTKWDPEGVFGFSRPSWGSEEVYLPTGIVRALQQLQAQERGLLSRGTNVFRYSILGLSPRYTAHILFGGTVMQGIREPRSLLMLGKAWKAMREGSLDDEVFRRPAEEGYEPYALARRNRAGGRDGARFAVQEYTEQVLGKPWGTSTVGDRLKAIANVNYTFTRYVRDLQAAAVYLDGAAKAEKRGTFLDPISGQQVEMTRERAFEEGMHAVYGVFGNLRRMTPFSRAMARSVMPFWGWTQHILRYVLEMPIDHPYRAMTLALLATEASTGVPKGLPERINFFLFLGSPGKTGAVKGLTVRFLDPFRTTANYGSLAGWIEALNPALSSTIAWVDPSLAQYGNPELYPQTTYTQFYGIDVAKSSGGPLGALEQYVPQVSALRALWGRTPAKAAHQIYEGLNVPFAQVQNVNLKQLAARDEISRYQVAKSAALTAFETGNFSLLDGYSVVPNPLNADYDITVPELKAMYASAQAAAPGVAPIESIAPPVTPAGY